MARELADTNQEQEAGNSAYENLAAEAWALPPQNSSSLPPKVYTAPASMAVVPLPPIPNKLLQAPYTSSVKLNVQITPAPEVGNIHGADDLKQVATGTVEGLRQAINQSLEPLSHPENIAYAAVSGVAVAGGAAQYYFVHTQQLGADTQQALLAARQAGLDTLNTFTYPMPQHEVGKYAGNLMPDFVAIGKIRALNAKEIEALGGSHKLEQMSAAELENIGIKRFDWSPPVDAHEVPVEAYRNTFTQETIHNKVTKYIFNPDSPKGWVKGQWFKKALGFDPFDPEHHQLLKEQIHFDPDLAVPRRDPNPHGQYGPRWNQLISITGPNGKTIHGIRIGWLKHKAHNLVQLTTIIPPG